MPTAVPDRINDIDHLEDLLSTPTDRVVETMSRINGDVLILGVGGKMGPTLARMVKRASDAAGGQRRVIGVARFSSPELQQRLESWGIETIKCDLLDNDQIAQLPDAPNIIYMAGMKFGATNQEPLTWAMNCILPSKVCERFPSSRIAAFSTGNVYEFRNVDDGGSKETDRLAPLGDYAMSCLGRERAFQYYSEKLSIPCVLIRLNYAVETRYGVLVDVATKIRDGQPIDLTMGYANMIWQGDANAYSICALECADSPAKALNVTGPEITAIEDVANRLGGLMDASPILAGSPEPTALISDASACRKLFGEQDVQLDQVMHWVADWIKRGESTIGKPTKFQVRDGKF